ncbi:MAG: dihydroorotase [Candidatus Pacebacteria bacterium]|nr:dihydroorotase [Candidatus Paceibacterota bacterium]
MAMRKGELDSITITRPDDMHLHLRDGAALMDIVSYSAAVFGRAIIMPNLKKPIIKAAQAWGYYETIRAAVKYHGLGLNFEPLMTLYLTDSTTPADIREAKASKLVYGVKLYPAGATTNSENGVTQMKYAAPALAEMEKIGMPLLVHGEVTDPAVDIFDREQVFIDKVLIPLMIRFPFLRIVMEHITTKEAVQFVRGERSHVGATITAHHLLENRNAIFKGGIRPHYYCLPILKREVHRQALVEAATSGDTHFFLGTDSAPHAKGAKEAACGCAGCFTAPAALELYVEAFDSMGKLDKLEGFASHHGADFYGLPRNTGTVTLVREAWKVPDEVSFGDNVVVPFRAGEMMQWKMQ